jgi:hypothetical protein
LRAEYYTKVLYPIQDKVISIFKDSPFYLTGGTALSRGYYNHRFSDDLDYFVSDRPDFQEITDKQVNKLLSLFKDLNVIKHDTNLYSFYVERKKLKIDIVNYTHVHIGKLVDHPILGVLDSKENILANKLTALVDRTTSKDIVDIFFLLRDGLNIKQALTDVKSKAAGISPPFIAKLLTDFNYGLIEKEIKWVNPVPVQAVKEYLKNTAVAIIEGIEQAEKIERRRQHHR